MTQTTMMLSGRRFEDGELAAIRDRGLRAAAVAMWKALWSAHCADPVELELFEGWRAGVAGATWWDIKTGTFRVLMRSDDEVEPRALLRRLFHELGHVVRGHCQKKDLLALDWARDAVLGNPGMGPEALREGLLAPTDEMKEHEAEADRFADEQMETFGPILERIGDEIERQITGRARWQ